MLSGGERPPFERGRPRPVELPPYLLKLIVDVVVGHSAGLANEIVADAFAPRRRGKLLFFTAVLKFLAELGEPARYPDAANGRPTGFAAKGNRLADERSIGRGVRSQNKAFTADGMIRGIHSSRVDLSAGNHPEANCLGEVLCLVFCRKLFASAIKSKTLRGPTGVRYPPDISDKNR